MIPVQLLLHNFMSYAQADLSFVGIHTACLTGNNGNGKSAILDAITWALWGQARGVDKNGAGMDDLVRLGCEDMAVEFVFDLEEQRYRVLRKRDKRRQVSALEFQIQEGQRFRSLSGSKLSETQAKITQVLKLDYETFSNSAFILQGQADAFTTQKASDRKRILGEILGLSDYDRLERKSRDKMNQADFQLREIDRKLAQLEEALSREAMIRQDWESSKNDKLALDTSLTRNQTQLEDLANRLAELQGMHKKKSELEQRISQSEQRLGGVERQVGVLTKKVMGLREILCREEEIAAGYERLQTVQAAEEELSRQQSRSLALIRQKHDLEQDMARERGKLERELAAVESQIEHEIKSLARGEQAEQEAEHLRRELSRLEALEAEKAGLQQKGLRLQGQIEEQKALRRALEQELQDQREHFKTVHAVEAQCPMCLRSLDPSQKQALLGRLTLEGREKRERENNLKLKLAELAGELGDTEQSIAALSTDNKPRVQSNLELARRDAAEGENAAKRLKALAARKSELSNSLEHATYAPQLKARLDVTLQELAKFDYDQDDHSRLRSALRELVLFREQYAGLTAARSSLPQEEELLQQLQAQLAREKQEIINHRETITLLQTQLVRLPQLTDEFAALKATINRQREEKSGLDARHGALEQKIQDLAELKVQKEQQLVQRAETATLKQHYNELVTAFGKKGIQAMIIENVVPELQQEANTLLSRMTDGRMHLTLLTQRDNKKGGVVETLDIRIGDELGTRKYETFSGGEAFRVNFALRIALSKLLARRAGAKLQTLVIDEGFGTQDGQGKERLVEVINAIKDDFAKIIIITHIQELKDAFPVQIEVEKTVNGSSLSVI